MSFILVAFCPESLVTIHKKSATTSGAERFAILEGKWWAIGDLNTGPHPYQGCALAN
jgi:hypothetical protein